MGDIILIMGIRMSINWSVFGVFALGIAGFLVSQKAGTDDPRDITIL